MEVFATGFTPLRALISTYSFTARVTSQSRTRIRTNITTFKKFVAVEGSNMAASKVDTWTKKSSLERDWNALRRSKISRCNNWMIIMILEDYI